jgi:hypothetical protein
MGLRVVLFTIGLPWVTHAHVHAGMLTCMSVDGKHLILEPPKLEIGKFEIMIGRSSSLVVGLAQMRSPKV